MPREMVQSLVGPYHVKVGWSPDRDVQVGVEADGERSIFWLLLGNEPPQIESLGEKVRTIVAHTIAERETSLTADESLDMAIGRLLLNTLDVHTHGGYAGLWSDLDRQGLNRLIRLLRRARDSAYGRDE